MTKYCSQAITKNIYKSNSEKSEITSQILYGENFKIIDCTFGLENNLENALDKLKNKVEQLVREGIKQIVLTDKHVSKEKLPIPMLLCIGAINTHLIKLRLR